MSKSITSLLPTKSHTDSADSTLHATPATDRAAPVSSSSACFTRSTWVLWLSGTSSTSASPKLGTYENSLWSPSSHCTAVARGPGNLPLLVASGKNLPIRTSISSFSSMRNGRPKPSRAYTRADRTAEVCPPSTRRSSQGNPLFEHHDSNVHLQLCDVSLRPSVST